MTNSRRELANADTSYSDNPAAHGKPPTAASGFREITSINSLVVRGSEISDSGTHPKQDVLCNVRGSWHSHHVREPDQVVQLHAQEWRCDHGSGESRCRGVSSGSRAFSCHNRTRVTYEHFGHSNRDRVSLIFTSSSYGRTTTSTTPDIAKAQHLLN